MDRFHAMQVFTRIVELGSFTKAADQLGMPRATVTHTIKQLEARLGARLLQRTTRHVSPTPDGEAYYQRCLRLLADLEEAEAVFTETTLNPRGKLRVDLPGAMGRDMVIPALPDFFARYPHIELEIGMGDRFVDLVREGVDCVLRVGELRDSSLVARRLGELEQVTCASAAYIAQYGMPKTLEDLGDHLAVNFYSTSSGRHLDFEFLVEGELRLVPMKSRVAVSSADAYQGCCRAGLGLIQAPRYPLREALEKGELVEVLPAWRPLPLPVSVLYPQHSQLAPRVRVFADWLAELFRQRRQNEAEA